MELNLSKASAIVIAIIAILIIIAAYLISIYSKPEAPAQTPAQTTATSASA